MVMPNIGGGYVAGSTGYDIGGNDDFSDPNLPDLNPEPYDPTVWETFWTFNGRGSEKYGVPKETFYLAYQKSDFNQTQATHTVKLYRKLSGQYTAHQTVMGPMEIVGWFDRNAVMEKAKEKAQFWLVHRYSNYPFDMGELDWAESVKWAESYVYGTGGNTGALFIAVVAIIGVVLLVR